MNILSVPQLGRSPLEYVCPAKIRLLNAYQEATVAHSTAMTHLQLNMGVMTKEEYATGCADTETLRMAARLAQEALNRHVRVHGC